jgi:hypothetical protein
VRNLVVVHEDELEAARQRRQDVSADGRFLVGCERPFGDEPRFETRRRSLREPNAGQ